MKKDEDIKLVEEWIGARTSRKMFASIHSIELEDFERIIDTAIAKQPKLEEQVAEQGKRASEVFLLKNKTFAKKIVEGKLSVDEFAKDRLARCNYDMMVRMLDLEERKILDQKIIEYISSGKAEITDYLNMFCEGAYNNESLKKAEDVIHMFDKKCINIPQLRKYIKGVKHAQRDLKTYEKPFKRAEVNKLGYYDEEKKESVMTEINDDLVEAAKKYINNNQGYICHRTMHQALMKLVRGEITVEQVQEEYDRIHKKDEKEQSTKEVIISNNESSEQMEDNKEGNVEVQAHNESDGSDSVGKQSDNVEKEDKSSSIKLQNLIRELRQAYNKLNSRKQECKELKVQLLAQLEVIKSEKIVTREKFNRLNAIVQENKEFFQELGELGNFEEKIRKAQEELEKKEQEEKGLKEKLADIDKDEKGIEDEKEEIKKQIHDTYLEL